MQTAEWYRERRTNVLSLSAADKATIREDWEALFGRAFAESFNLHCPNCYADAIILILRKMAKHDNGGYELKRGIAFRYKGKVYTASNITPDAAEWYIKQDLTHRDDFVTLARDYDDYERQTKRTIKIEE